MRVRIKLSEKSVKSAIKRTERLSYNRRYDAKKRVARKLGLLPRYPRSIVLMKPKAMSVLKFETIVQKHHLI